MGEFSSHLTDKCEQDICIIVPTYNNERTLARVLDEVLAYSLPIIVINDGSTDTTPFILQQYPQIKQLHLPTNKGKGNALRVGFAQAKTLGYDYAITIDSDGQHFAKDIPAFISEIQGRQHPVLLIGSRNMTHESVPKNSSFGNRFSNFWFWFETGIKLTDTQSGFRAYPLAALPSRLYTDKFEFEIEVIVRAAWKGIEVKNVPIEVLYDPEERVSHFRPLKDFLRISILNTVLVCITLLWIKPRDFFLNFKKKSFRTFLREDVWGTTDSPLIKSLSIALGVFMGIAPFWGFQTAIVITLAIAFRLNKGLAFLFSNISIPPFIPVIVYVSLQTGAFLLGDGFDPFYAFELNWQGLKEHAVQYLVGSFTLALGAASLFGVASFVLFSICSRKINLSE